MKKLSFILALFFFRLALANEFVEFNTELQVLPCPKSATWCGTSLYRGVPVSVEISPISSGSSALSGQFENQQNVDNLTFTSSFRVLKIPSGPDQGYVIQVFLFVYETAISSNSTLVQLGTVSTSDPSMLGRTNFKFTFIGVDTNYVVIIPIGPKSLITPAP